MSAILISTLSISKACEVEREFCDGEFTITLTDSKKEPHELSSTLYIRKCDAEGMDHILRIELYGPDFNRHKATITSQNGGMLILFGPKKETQKQKVKELCERFKYEYYRSSHILSLLMSLVRGRNLNVPLEVRTNAFRRGMVGGNQTGTHYRGPNSFDATLLDN